MTNDKTKEAPTPPVDLSVSGRTQYAVACSMVKEGNRIYTHTTTLHINFADSEDAAMGMAIESAMKMRPGFAVAHVVATEIPNPSNVELTGGASAPSSDRRERG